MYPRIPTDEDVRRPAGLSFDNLPDIVTVAEVCDATRLDKKTVLKAIHGKALPAWFPGGSAQLGFRMHKGDVEAWFFSDPGRAFTKGTGDTRVKP
jgi:excisionase family DNA binding protein